MDIVLNDNESLSSAISKANEGDRIFLANRTYREKVTVDKKGLTIVGHESGDSRVVFGDHANKMHADGKEYNTFRSYSVIVCADDVSFIGFTIENDAGDPAEKGQQVALSVCGKNFSARSVTLVSTQDTLFLAPLPDDLITRYDGFLSEKERYMEGQAYSLFIDCTIKGSVDFIFGCGSAFFFNSAIVSVCDGRKIGYVCAPAHSLKQDFGITFVSCNFSKEGSFDSEIYLARPWRDYGKATFISCRYGDNIDERLFDKWNDTERNKTARFELFDCPINENAVGWLRRLSEKDVKKYIEKLNELNEKIGR